MGAQAILPTESLAIAGEVWLLMNFFKDRINNLDEMNQFFLKTQSVKTHPSRRRLFE